MNLTEAVAAVVTKLNASEHSLADKLQLMADIAALIEAVEKCGEVPTSVFEALGPENRETALYVFFTSVLSVLGK